jgi:hypothetical protein
MAGRVRDIGRRHADRNLAAAGDLFEGRALVKQGRVAEGMDPAAVLARIHAALAPGDPLNGVFVAAKAGA